MNKSTLLECGTPTKKDEDGKLVTELIYFDAGIGKFHGIYRLVDMVMCKPCYDNMVRGLTVTCRYRKAQTGDVVSKHDYLVWREKQSELEKIQQKIAQQQKTDLLRNGKIG